MLTIFIILTVIFTGLALYACCVAASKDDRAIEEEELRFWEEEKYK